MTVAEASHEGGGASVVAADRVPLSLRYLGFGLYWAWIWVLLNSSTLFARSSHTSEDINMLRLAGTSAMALTLLIAAMLAVRLSQPSRQRLLLAGGCALGPIGTLASALGHGLTGPAWLYVSISGWIASGVAGACVTWLWAEFFGEIDVRRTSVYLSASVALGAGVYFAVTYLAPAAALVIAAMLPLASVGMCRLAARELVLDLAIQPVPSRRTFPPILWHIVWGITVYAIAFGLLKGMGAPEDSQIFESASRFSVLGVGIMGLLLTIGMLAFWSTRSFAPAYRLILPTMVAGFLLLPFISTDKRMLASAAVTAGFECFDILSCIVLFDVARRLHLSPTKVFGFGRFANIGGICVGWAISIAFLGRVQLGQLTLIALSLGAVFLLVLTTALVLNERELLSPEIPLAGDATSPALHGVLAAPGVGGKTLGPWRQRCAMIAENFGLSPREEEVLVLLAKGRSIEHIRTALFISEHTVKTHVYHIHKKLGIHSREELLDLIETYGSSADA